MKRIDADPLSLRAALKRAVDQGVASQEAEQLLAKAERGEQVAPAELKALLDTAGDRFEAADRAALEAVIGGQDKLPSADQVSGGRPAHQVWMADRAGDNVAGWWSKLGSLENALFPEAPAAQVTVGGETFTQADLETALGAVGQHALGAGNAQQGYVNVGGASASPFLGVADAEALSSQS